MAIKNEQLTLGALAAGILSAASLIWMTMDRGAAQGSMSEKVVAITQRLEKVEDRTEGSSKIEVELDYLKDQVSRDHADIEALRREVDDLRAKRR